MSEGDTVQKAGGEPTRLIGTGWDEDGNDTAQSVLTGTSQKVRALCLTSPDLVIPVLFLPGTMGTRLKIKNRAKAPAWFPPEGTLQGLVAVIKHLSKSAADRQRLLDPNNTEIDDNGPASPDESSKALLAIAEGNTDEERAKWRGWGQVYGKSYSEILSVLEKSFAMIFDPSSQGKRLTTTWKTMVIDQQDATRLGAQKSFEPLDDNVLRDAADVLYPVHAVGYNWLQSNVQSGKWLAQEIGRITSHYRSKGKKCEKVILVTHSMGGLVARACVQMPGLPDQILGIVHGVMPAIGAPAAYKRFKAGFEGVEQVLLGRNAAECTAVMANAPGTLELLPTRKYKTKSEQGERHWLRASYAVSAGSGASSSAEVLLGDADPYADIYLNNTKNWWKLIREDLINPARMPEAAGDSLAVDADDEVVGDNPRKSDFATFTANMMIAKGFQDLVEDKYHPMTYAYYAADRKHLSWSEVHWKSDKPFLGEIKEAVVGADDLNGALKLSCGATITGDFSVEAPKGLGDGTVPEESGSAPTPYVVQIFRHGGKEKGHESYDHQDSYKAKLAQAVTLYSIVKIVAQSSWVKQQLSC